MFGMFHCREDADESVGESFHNLPHCDHLSSQDEQDSAEQLAEIESLLYSQIYFEENDMSGLSDFEPAAEPDFDISVIEKNPTCPSSFAPLVNFSGRTYLSSKCSDDTGLGLSNQVDVINTTASLSGNDERKQLISSTPVKPKKSKNKNKRKKKNTSTQAEEHIVLVTDSDSDSNKLLIKDSKSSRNKSVIEINSSGEDHSVFSSSDEFCMLSEDEDLDDESPDAIQLNVTGVTWGAFRDPQSTCQRSILEKLNLCTWDGNPPLTIAEALSLLKSGDWSLVREDVSGSGSKTRRYYGVKNIFCHNCNAKGHLARDCSKQRKGPTCILCGNSGHLCRKCPEALCTNCDLSGHENRQCQQPRKSWRVTCHRCNANGHIRTECPELWRMYHATTKEGKLVSKDVQWSKHVYCFNCGKKGHFGFECNARLMSRYAEPPVPVVGCYDLPTPALKRNHSAIGEPRKNWKKKKSESPTREDNCTQKTWNSTHKEKMKPDHKRDSSSIGDVVIVEEHKSGSVSAKKKLKKVKNPVKCKEIGKETEQNIRSDKKKKKRKEKSDQNMDSGEQILVTLDLESKKKKLKKKKDSEMKDKSTENKSISKKRKKKSDQNIDSGGQILVTLDLESKKKKKDSKMKDISTENKSSTKKALKEIKKGDGSVTSPKVKSKNPRQSKTKVKTAGELEKVKKLKKLHSSTSGVDVSALSDHKGVHKDMSARKHNRSHYSLNEHDESPLKRTKKLNHKNEKRKVTIGAGGFIVKVNI